MTQNSSNLQPPGQVPADFARVFAVCRVEPVRRGRVVSGILLPHLEPGSPPVKELFARWEGSHAVRKGAFGYEVLLFEPAHRRERWWLHVLLFVATLFSTMLAGALLAGRYPVEFAALYLFDGWWLPIPVGLDLSALAVGLPFGMTLVGILAVHEAGHYFAARRYRITVTPPYFIPFPPYISVIGTLGAFIRLRSPVLSRRHLLDVGVAGPLMSFFASLPVLWWGLLHSRVLSTPFDPPSLYLVRFASERFWLGGSPIVVAMTRLLVGMPPAGHTIELHPVAFAGWLGLFVTALNLLPISQLDGGHILYALLGPRQKVLAWAFFLALIPLGFLWAGWWVWAALVFLVGRGRIQHPPLFDAAETLNRERIYVGLASAVIFLLCFVPMPFRI